MRGGSVTIFCSGEAISPDMNIFDYAIVFDRNHVYGDRICRKPTMLFFEEKILNKETALEKEDAKKLLDEKTGFCNFIYSNPNAHEKRDKLFYGISSYKQVDSLGKHLNNKKKEELYDDWCSNSIMLKRPYKFSISAENASFSGYTSEKILTSFQAHSIPIYWGDPSICDEFNEKAFIDCNKYENMNQLLDVIKKIDNDDELYCRILSEPWQTMEQVLECERKKEEYEEFLCNVFNNKQKRVGKGTAPSIYYGWFSKRKYVVSQWRVLYNKMLKIYHCIKKGR